METRIIAISTQPETDPAFAAARVDWPLAFFWAGSFLLAWGIVPLLAAIARSSGVADWLTLSRMAEQMAFADTALVVPGWLVYLLTRLQDFSFSIAGVLLIAITDGRDGLRQLFGRLRPRRIRGGWWLLALLPAFLYIAAAFLSGALPGAQLNAEILRRALFSFSAGLLVTLFLRGPVGEELGLRGFALPRLQARMSSFRASAWIGFFWALWHLPVLIGRDLLALVAFLLVAFSLSFLFTLLFNGSGGSLLPALLFHGLQNNEEMFELIFPALQGTGWELISTLGLLAAGIIAMALVWRSAGGRETAV